MTPTEGILYLDTGCHGFYSLFLTITVPMHGGLQQPGCSRQAEVCHRAGAGRAGCHRNATASIRRGGQRAQLEGTAGAPTAGLEVVLAERRRREAGRKARGALSKADTSLFLHLLCFLEHALAGKAGWLPSEGHKPQT